MRRVRIESHSHDPIAGLVAGVEWVNDSTVAVVDLDDRGGTPFVVLEDRDGSGEAETLNLQALTTASIASGASGLGARVTGKPALGLSGAEGAHHSRGVELPDSVPLRSCRSG